jgi:hypothetical protein
VLEDLHRVHLTCRLAGRPLLCGTRSPVEHEIRPPQQNLIRRERRNGPNDRPVRPRQDRGVCHVEPSPSLGPPDASRRERLYDLSGGPVAQLVRAVDS